MAATQRYLGARTAFGVIIRIEDRVYNPAVTVKASDGTIHKYRLPLLIAHGLTLRDEAHTYENAPLVSPSGSPSVSDPAHPFSDTPTSTCP